MKIQTGQIADKCDKHTENYTVKYLGDLCWHGPYYMIRYHINFGDNLVLSKRDTCKSWGITSFIFDKLFKE